MACCEVVGDTIEFDGQVVARINPAVQGTLLGRLEEALQCACESDDKNFSASEYEETMERIRVAAGKKAQGGLISLIELEAIIKTIDEGTDVDQPVRSN